MKLKSLVLAVAAIAVFAAPLSLSGIEMENPDYWCGYRCENGTSCKSTPSTPANDACVWYGYNPWHCLTDTESDECSVGSGP